MSILFERVSSETINTQPVQKMIGTNSEEFVPSEILTLASGYLTKAAVTSAGTQQYMCLNTATGDATTKNVGVMQLLAADKYRVESDGQLAAAKVGTVVTLDTAATGITDTATAGVFQIDETDGTATSIVTGHFVNTVSQVL